MLIPGVFSFTSKGDEFYYPLGIVAKVGSREGGCGCSSSSCVEGHIKSFAGDLGRYVDLSQDPEV